MSDQKPKPSLGRIVLINSPLGDKNPLPAIITRVWNDECVNVCAFQQDGTPLPRTSHTFVADLAANPSGPHWSWPPRV